MKNVSNIRRQRGYSLIIAVAVVTLLGMVGVMVLDSVYTDTQLAGGDRGATNAMYLAEAGAVWAKQDLVDLLYPPGSAGAAAYASVKALPTLPSNDPLCPENNCVAPPCPAPIVCTGWHLLTPTDWVAYGNGQYRVAATCNPSCDTNSLLPATAPESYSVRALGTSPDKSQRLIELTVGK